MHKILTVFGIVMVMFTCARNECARDEKPPQAVLDVLKNDLPKDIERMLNDKDRASIGFYPRDNIQGMTYSQPFRMLPMNPVVLEESCKQKSLDTLKKDVGDNSWYALVLFNGEARALISIDFLRSKWRISSFSADPRYKDIQQLFRIYPMEDIMIFEAYYFHEYYFHVLNKDNTNLTLLSKKGLSELSPQEPLSKVKSVIGNLTDVEDVSKDITKRVAEETARRGAW
jgi:hypothetical protein